MPFVKPYSLFWDIFKRVYITQKRDRLTFKQGLFSKSVYISVYLDELVEKIKYFKRNDEIV